MTALLFELLGALGLFLIGMWLLTEGLKLAGGQALGRLLGQWTSGRTKGLLSGVLITALVQSSSAVTVATIGFVNAGLLNFKRAVWVVFGSNLGTTFTAWIVSLFGFTVSIEAYTFPLVGIGAALRIFSPYERGKSLGMALAGFGLLFMGIDALQNSFGDYARELDVAGILSGARFETLWAVGVGFLLTLLTQSSSAAIVIVLTAAASGVATLDTAAAAVIGANLGTTSTAFLAAIGATANARRLAWAHVAFNGLTATVALIGLPLFLGLVRALAPASAEDNLAVMLAIFHSSFNLLGVLLMWPLEPPLSRRLMRLYTHPSQPPAKESHLDDTLITVPDLALRAMTLELRDLLRAASRLPLPQGDPATVIALEERLGRFRRFLSRALKARVTQEQSQLFGLGLSASHHLHYACDTLHEVAEKYRSLEHSALITSPELRHWFEAVSRDARTLGDSLTAADSDRTSRYQQVKSRLLARALGDAEQLDDVDTALQAASQSRRFVEQIQHASDACRILGREVLRHSSSDSPIDAADADTESAAGSQEA